MEFARLATAGAALAIALGIGYGTLNAEPEKTTYLVHAKDVNAAAHTVEQLGGSIVSRMPSVGILGVALTPAQLQQLQSVPSLKVSENRSVSPSQGTASSSDQTEDSTPYAQWTDAHDVHQQGITGRGVTVAFVDTGLWTRFQNDARVVATMDTVGEANTGKNGGNDGHGHGTHVMLSAVNTDTDDDGFALGIAPGANLFSVRAFNDDGEGTYLDVIEGIDHVISNKDTYNIRVLNLSFGAPPQSFYWEDPLNRAVMAAWNAGIVVVVSAGNMGPDAFSIGVPANTPYVISVGAVSNNLTSDDSSDDFVTSFSSAGPTFEAFVKPELVAPGDRIAAPTFPGGGLAKSHRSEKVKSAYYAISGTSQAAAITSGVAALLLEAKPHLSPNDVKCQLLHASRALVTEGGTPLYSALQQGAGMINAALALSSTESGCANVGLDLEADLYDDVHFRGPVSEAANGDLIISGPSGEPAESGALVWDGSYNFTQGYTWGGGGNTSLWDQGYTWGGGGNGAELLWSNGYSWGGGGNTSLWSQGYTWGGGGNVSSDGYTWGGGGNTSLQTNDSAESESPRN